MGQTPILKRHAVKACLCGHHLRLATDRKAMIKKATPAQNQLSVRNQTTMAIMAAGKKKRRTLAMTMIMMRPIARRISSAMISKRKGKPGRLRGGAIGTSPPTKLFS